MSDMTPKIAYAHSVEGEGVERWERLEDHLASVARASAEFARPFGWSEVARFAGLLHDIGKCSPAFQSYITASSDGIRRGPNHSSAGAREALGVLQGPLGCIVAAVIAGHHAGLADGDGLERRLTSDIEDYGTWRKHVPDMPTSSQLVPTRNPKPSPERGFTLAFLARMLFSCLVDADRLETGSFYARAGGRDRGEAGYTSLAALNERLVANMARTSAAAMAKADGASAKRLNRLRSEILSHALRKAALPPGLFTLTVPTGGGKTLTSLSFALEHACQHALHRVIYVIPFTSIIEQTASVFRTVLASEPGGTNETDILEHHATFDWEAALQRDGAEDGRGVGAAEHLRRATENWDAPIVVTTAVQFFESLFSNRPSPCRKLHNLAGAVIVLDEAQTLPLRILRPCLAALDELARNYGASIVLCTATQPAWRKLDDTLVMHRGHRAERNVGLDISPARELAPAPESLFTALKRVDVERRDDPIADDVIAARFAEQRQMLCIVNSRRHAKVLFDRIADMSGAIHLSTWMCPRHRRIVLAQARRDLVAGRPVRIVSTSLIEAGVDIDLPEVWRAASGLDSILQAAGRCNREFRHQTGRLVIFEPVEDKGPPDLRQAWQAGRTVLRRHADPQTLDAIRAFFGELYRNKGGDRLEALDGSTLGKEPWPILPQIAARADRGDFPFQSIAGAFKVIEDAMESVIVPWSSGSEDDEAARLLGRMTAMDKPRREDLRRLQQYTVSIPKNQRDTWLAEGVLAPVHPALGDALLRFADCALYDERSGLRVTEPDRFGD